jgi:hypothetical protein
MLLASSDVSCAPGSSSRGEDRCAWCGDLMPDRLRAEAKFCSKRCRQAASRSRLKSKPAAPAPSPPPETRAWCGEPMPAGLRREARYCGKRCRQASPRFGLALKHPVPVPAAAQTPGPRDRSRPSPTPAGATRRRRRGARFLTSQACRAAPPITTLPVWVHRTSTCGGRLPTSSDDRSTAAKRSSR